MLRLESITLFGLSALLLLAAPGGAGAQQGAPDPESLREFVREYRQQHEAEIVREFAELLAIPNVASDSENIRMNAEHIADMMSRRGIEARLLETEGYPPARTPLELPVSRALIRTVEVALGEPPIVMPTLGGSVPMYLFNDVLGTPTIGLPIANHDNNQHAPNENLRIQNLWDAIEIFAAVLARTGHELQ